MSQSTEAEKFCAFCNNPSNLSCARCRIESYCSQKCQIDDFPNHRYICFPLPDLIQIATETPTSSVDNEILEEQNETHLEGTENQLDEQDETQLEGTENQLLETSKPKNDELEQQNDMIKADNSNITCNDTVVGSISITSSMMDALDDEEVDYMLKQTQKSFVSIENLKNLRISEQIAEKEEAPMTNQVIPLKKACHEIIASKADKLFMMKDLKLHEWPKSKNIKVKLQTIVQHPNVMAFVEDKKLIEQFYEFMESEIAKYRPCISEDYHEYLPKKYEIVLGHYNGSWYRAVVLDSDPKGIIVLFIDYGNMALLLMDEILPISNEYYINKLSFEVCSRQFIVDNVPAELDDKQQEILDSQSMMITNIRVDDKGLTHCEIFGF